MTIEATIVTNHGTSNFLSWHPLSLKNGEILQRKATGVYCSRQVATWSSLKPDSQIVFWIEADLPRIEAVTGQCNRRTGAGCQLIPATDDCSITLGCAPAVFYPFFSIAKVDGQCVWRLGNHIPGSLNDFGQNAEYGALLNLTYTGLGGAPFTRYNDF